MPTSVPVNLDYFWEASQDVMIVINVDGVLQHVNQHCQELLGVTDSDIRKTCIFDFVHKEDFEPSKNIVKQASQSNERLSFLNRFIQPDGLYRLFNWSLKADPKSGFIYCVGIDVTEAKRTEAALNALEEATGVGVWNVDQETKEVNWSAKVHDIHETCADEFTPNLDNAITFYPPESIPILTDAMQRMATGEKVSFEVPIITKKGNKVWVETKLFAEMRDSVVINQYGTFEDITEKRAQRIENEKLRERVDLAMQASNIGVWEFDTNTNRLTWDEQMYVIYGLEPNKFANTFEDWEGCLVVEDRDVAKRNFETALSSSGVFSDTFRINTKDGEQKYISAIGKIIKDEQSGSTYVTGINWDITEQELSRIALLKAKEEAEAADVAKSNFLANMSHEIRTPLNGILGALQLMQSSNDANDQATQLEENDERQNKMTSIALKSTNSLIQIINDILDFSKIQANALELESLDVDVFGIVEDVVREQSLIHKNKDITSSINASKQARSYWHTDPLRFKQIVNNLVSNAFKFSENGQILINMNVVKGELCLSIKDTGIGMDKDEIASLFTPFKQADESISRKFGGTGLGLAITQDLVKLLKGNISVESTKNQGTTFTLAFPFERVQYTHIHQKSTEYKELPDLANQLIYVAEDNVINQMLIQEMLKPTNARIIMFENGQALLQGLKRKTPDLVLCDIMMPVLDGISACEEIRKTDQTLPIIAFTASVMSTDADKYYQSGFNDILPKPLLLEEIREILHKYLVSKEQQYKQAG